jgi:phage tail sheath protein FI
MAESIISPGVYTRENDTSFITPAPIQAGAAFVGPTVKGPDNQPLIVTSYSDYVRKFGETFLSSSDKQYEFLTSVAVKNYFQNGGQTALVTRVVSGTYQPAANTNIASGLAVGDALATGSGVLAGTSADGQQYAVVNGSSTYTFVASDAPIPADQPSANIWYFPTGSSVETTIENLVQEINDASAYVPVSASKASATALALSGSAAGTAYNGITFITGSAAGAAPDSPAVITLAGGTDVASSTFSFKLGTLGKGVIYNNSTGLTDAGVENSDGSLVSGSADNLRWEIQNVNTAVGTFSLVIRRGDDSTNSKTILETFTVSLDPSSDLYIEKVIGNQYMTVGTDGSTSYNYTVGEYPNRSNYVRVSEVVLPTNNYLANDGVTVNTGALGAFSLYLPVAASGSFCSASGSVKSGAVFFKDITTSANNSQGVEAADYSTALSLLSNKDEYQFNIISTPGLLRGNSEFTSTVDSVITLAEERGDCIAVVDLVGPDSQIVDATGAAVALNSSYAATYWPWLQINSATGRNEWIPAGTVIPGVYAFTDASSAPWFAPAGLVRGGIGGIIQAERKLTKGNRDTLYAAKVNPIATFPGSGISIMGQKTLQTKASALDRVNVRRLLIELKKFIGDQARNLVFEQNTIATRNRFLATVNPYLESVIQRQGLYAYRVVMDDTNNTADVVDRNQLIGQVFIQPTKTVEFVVLDFTIEPTGATFA